MPMWLIARGQLRARSGNTNPFASVLNHFPVFSIHQVGVYARFQQTICVPIAKQVAFAKRSIFVH